MEDKIKQLDHKLAEIMKQQKFEWAFPTEFELAKNRQEFRNVYGYSIDFVSEHDMFGENRFFQGQDKLNELKISTDG